jgi:L,D-transpeptidase catalytic domain
MLAIVAGPSPALAVESQEPDAVERLHRPGVRSYYAFVDQRAVVRARPRPGARTVTRLGLRTEDGTHELVLALARTTDVDGRAWLQVRLPIRPNNRTGWVPETALSELQPLDTWLRVDTRRLSATLVKGRRVVFRARVGVGEPRWPTPRGEFYIRHKLSGYGRAGAFYGPVAFGTNARSTKLTDWPGGAIVGIHGTSLPNLIPGRISHGCVRLHNRDILRLERLMPVGTPLTIR